MGIHNVLIIFIKSLILVIQVDVICWREIIYFLFKIIWRTVLKFLELECYHFKRYTFLDYIIKFILLNVLVLLLSYLLRNFYP